MAWSLSYPLFLSAEIFRGKSKARPFPKFHNEKFTVNFVQFCSQTTNKQTDGGNYATSKGVLNNRIMILILLVAFRALTLLVE